MYIRYSLLIVIMLIISVFSMALKDHKPRRGKHYLKPQEVGSETVEELEEHKVEEEQSFLNEIRSDSRLKEWIAWWRNCEKSFGVDELVDAGVFSMAGEWKSYDPSELKGPNKNLVIKKGGRTLYPVWGRMKYVKDDNVWQARMDNSFCGVVIYEKDKSRQVIKCGELDGVFQGFWVGKDRFAILAYRKISPEMDTRCEAKEVGQCVAPILWLGDLSNESIWEYRGPVVTFEKCEPNKYLLQLYPDFFIQDSADISTN